MATIGDALGDASDRLFVGRRSELQVFRSWLAAEAAPLEILNVTGIGGVGKTALTATFARVAAERERRATVVDGRAIHATSTGVLQALGVDSVEQAIARLNQERPLLIFDTFEEMTDLTRWLLEELLPHLDVGVKVVIAGRHPLGMMWLREPWRLLVRPLPLDGFSSVECREYLALRGLTDPDVIDRIVAVSGGHPLAMSLAADLALHYRVRDFTAASEWRLTVRALVEQLLNEVHDHRLRELLDVGSVVRQFDEGMLAAVAQRRNVGPSFDRLSRLSMVRATEHGLMLHDDVRRIMADDLRWRDRRRYNELRLRALAHLCARMKAATGSEREAMLVEQYYLWENEYVQAALFVEDDPGEIWVEAARPGDRGEIMEIERIWHDEVLRTLVPFEYDHGFTREFHFSWYERVLRCPAVRIRLARDRDGRAIGYNMMAPIYRESLPLFDGHAILEPALRAYLAQLPADAVADTAEDATVVYLLQSTHMGIKPAAVGAALWRDMFGVLALGRRFLVTLGLDAHKALFRTLGFERVGGMTPLAFGGCVNEGFVLDLTGVGVEAWIEGLMSGAPAGPPSAMALDEALQTILSRVHDDVWVATRPEAHLVAAAVGALDEGAPVVRPARLRHGLTEALARAREESPALDSAFRAVELAYLTRDVGHSRAPHRLAVSRRTFYRLLKRGVTALALAIERS